MMVTSDRLPFSELFLLKRIEKQICIGVHKMECDTHKETKSMMFNVD